MLVLAVFSSAASAAVKSAEVDEAVYGVNCRVFSPDPSPVPGSRLPIVIYAVGAGCSKEGYDKHATAIVNRVGGGAIVAVVDTNPGSWWKTYDGYSNAFRAVQRNLVNGSTQWAAYLGAGVVGDGQRTYAGGHSMGGGRAIAYAMKNAVTVTGGVITWDPYYDGNAITSAIVPPVFMAGPKASIWCPAINSGNNAQHYYDYQLKYSRVVYYRFGSDVEHNNILDTKNWACGSKTEKAPYSSIPDDVARLAADFIAYGHLSTTTVSTTNVYTKLSRN
jgi:hypothetical protein